MHAYSKLLNLLNTSVKDSHIKTNLQPLRVADNNATLRLSKLPFLLMHYTNYKHNYKEQADTKRVACHFQLLLMNTCIIWENNHL